MVENKKKLQILKRFGQPIRLMPINIELSKHRVPPANCAYNDALNPNSKVAFEYNRS